MAISTTPLASTARGTRLSSPLVFEALLVAVIIGLVLPWFGTYASRDAGRDGRFAEAALGVRGLPPALLPEICRSIGADAEDLVRERLCRHLDIGSSETPAERLPAAVTNVYARVREAFGAPVREAEARLAELRRVQRDGAGDVLATGDAIDAIEAELAPFLARYGIGNGPAGTPQPLACAFDSVRMLLAPTLRRGAPALPTLRANAVLLLAGALDGHGAVNAIADAAVLPPATARPAVCGMTDAAAALGSAATLMRDARSAPLAVAKNDATRELMHTAGLQWAAWAFAGLLLLDVSRRGRSIAPAVALTLAVWAAAAWIGRVPWPLAGEHAFTPGRATSSWMSMPAPFVLVLAAAAVLVLAASPWLRGRVAPVAEVPASVITYPGLVLATGIGWLLLLDLSGNGHYSNRYLALYHQGHLWLGMLVFTLLACVRQPLGRALAWGLSLVDAASGRIARALGGIGGVLILLVMALAMTVAIAAVLANMRQLTSELGRVWLIVGAAWFFFLRGTPLAERLAASGNSLASLVRYVWPLLFVVLVLIGAMVLTRDMGPLLIAGYGAGAFVAASIAMWGYQRNRAAALAYGIALVLFASWIAVTTVALLRVGSIDAVTAARLENAAAPLASANDHLALVTWFQRAAPPSGFGPGAVPWCGLGTSRSCAGVPAQIQSDYTFTALVGMFGWFGAWALTLGCVMWLHRAVWRHAGVTRGEPRLVSVGGRLVNDEQAFVSWLCVAWMVLALCQLAVTVAGNLGVIPLTGVTFPFVSFGMTSLVINMAMLGLAVNVNDGARA